MPLSSEQLQEIEDRTKKADQLVSDPDKIDIVDPEEKTKSTGDEEAPEVLAAREEGWVPKDEWEGNPDDWIDAKEFLFRGELMGRIKKQTKFINSMKGEIEDMRTALQELGEHNKKIAEQERKKALDELKQAKKDAFEERDFDTMEEIDERMSELKSVDLSKEPEVKKDDPPQTDIHPDVDAWLKKNDWYEKDKILQGVANGAIQQLLAEDPELEETPAELLEEAKKIVMAEMPHKFEDSTRKATPRSAVVEPDTRSRSTSGRKDKFSAKHLNEEQLRIGRTFVNAKALASLDEYATQLAELGELDIQKGE